MRLKLFGRSWRRKKGRRQGRKRQKSSEQQHACELFRGSESHLPRLPPNAPLLARTRRRLQKFLLVSASHPFTGLYLRSKAAIAFEKRRHGISPNWWIIHPCSSFRCIRRIIIYTLFVAEIIFLTFFYLVNITLIDEMFNLQ